MVWEIGLVLGLGTFALVTTILTKYVKHDALKILLLAFSFLSLIALGASLIKIAEINSAEIFFINTLNSLYRALIFIFIFIFIITFVVVFFDFLVNLIKEKRKKKYGYE